MATSYKNAIQKIQPQGPYTLCGFSFGATLAFEIARQLRREDQMVNPLFFFDGWAKFSDEQSIETSFKEKIIAHEQNNLAEKDMAELSWKRMELLLNYKIRRCKQEIILFKASELLPEYNTINQQYNYWDKHTSGKITVYEIPGNHETILNELHVAIMADKMSTILKDVYTHETTE